VRIRGLRLSVFVTVGFSFEQTFDFAASLFARQSDSEQIQHRIGLDLAELVGSVASRVERQYQQAFGFVVAAAVVVF